MKHRKDGNNTLQMYFSALFILISSDLINESKEEQKPSKEEVGNSTSGNSATGLRKTLYKQGSEKITQKKVGIPYIMLFLTFMLNFS